MLSISTEPPIGWRFLTEGEEILFGDYFNARTFHPEAQPFWCPYQKLIGQPYTGYSMLGIRPLNPNAPLPSNFEPQPYYSGQQIGQITSKSIKARVSEYLEKQKK